ncbi:MAG TPA: hypothetical protein VGR84_18910 [Candidatus Acidoferrales bacterium]|nr:hypothetical protein [Candidatus Acidoferrales bacterium]
MNSSPSPFDPSQPFTAESAPPFDPNKPFTRPAFNPQRFTMAGEAGSHFMHGLEAPLVGLDTLASKIEENLPFVSEKTAAADVAAAKKQEEEFAKRVSPGFGGWELAGSMANPLNYLVPGAAATKLGRAAMSMGSGAAAASLEPGTPVTDDFWSKKRGEILAGTLAGGATHVGLHALGNLIAPPMSALAKYLASKGVELTPGQMGTGGGMIGRQIRRAEEAFKSFPILGSFIRSGEGRSIESFDRATINQALEPIGQSLPKNVEIGHTAVAHAADKVNDAYDHLLPHIHFGTDRQFASDIANLRGMVMSMPAPQIEQFSNILRHRLATRLAPTGMMDGKTFKQVDSELRVLSEPYIRSPDAAQQQLGRAIQEVRSAMRAAVTRQNPKYATRLQNINNSYAMLTRIEQATSRRLQGTGVFTPADLLAAVKSQDMSRRRREFAHADALMQDWASAGQQVLPAKMPDSGTPERALYLGSLLGAERVFPGGEKAAAAGLAGALPYTRLGQAALNAAARSPKTRAASRAIKSAAPYVAPGAAIAVTRPENRGIEPMFSIPPQPGLVQ